MREGSEGIRALASHPVRLGALYAGWPAVVRGGVDDTSHGIRGPVPSLAWLGEHRREWIADDLAGVDPTRGLHAATS